MVCVALCVGEAVAFSIITKYLGISDTIFGIWVGILSLLLSISIVKLLDKYKIKFLFRKPLIFVLFSFILLYPLYAYKLIDVYNKIFGMDKIIFGFITGILSYLLGLYLNEILIKRGIKFKLQKNLVPMSIPILLSLLYYILKI